MSGKKKIVRYTARYSSEVLAYLNKIGVSKADLIALVPKGSTGDRIVAYYWGDNDPMEKPKKVTATPEPEVEEDDDEELEDLEDLEDDDDQ